MERTASQLVVGVAAAAVGVYLINTHPDAKVYGWGLAVVGSWVAISVHPLVWDSLLDINTWTRGSTYVGDGLDTDVDADDDNDDDD